MNNLLTNKIYISKSKIPNSGRGVFASVDIKKGELIERCPVIELSELDFESVNQTSLVNYIYYLGKNKDRLILVLGFGSLYNHSYQPNAVYKYKPKSKVIDFIALKGIKKDEEITVNYNQGTKSEAPLWFEVP